MYDLKSFSQHLNIYHIFYFFIITRRYYQNTHHLKKKCSLFFSKQNVGKKHLSFTECDRRKKFVGNFLNFKNVVVFTEYQENLTSSFISTNKIIPEYIQFYKRVNLHGMCNKLLIHDLTLSILWSETFSYFRKVVLIIISLGVFYTHQYNVHTLKTFNCGPLYKNTRKYYVHAASAKRKKKSSFCSWNTFVQDIQCFINIYIALFLLLGWYRSIHRNMSCRYFRKAFNKNFISVLFVLS